MASGDVVGDIYTSATTFQPAAGVQICITQFLATDENRLLGRGDIDTSTTFLIMMESQLAVLGLLLATITVPISTIALLKIHNTNK